MSHYTATNPVNGKTETKISTTSTGLAVFAKSPSIYGDRCYLYGWTRDDDTARRMVAEAKKLNAATETWLVPVTKHD